MSILSLALVLALAETAIAPRYRFPLRAFRVGGIRFLRVGRLQVSFCITRKP